MNERPAGAVAPDDRARAVRFAYASFACGLVGVTWMLVRNDLGEPNLLLVLVCVAVSVLAIVFGSRAVRRTRGLPRTAAILGLVAGSLGAGLGGVYLLLTAPFLLWALFAGM